jgi:RNA polymerase sigma factor (sigma-70 family)
MLVNQAKNGNKGAFEEVVRRIQDLIYGLAIRMLWHPDDAEDATQEILIKIITHLDSFRGECAFTSWVYRISSNHLLTTIKSRAEKNIHNFNDFEAILDRELPESSPNADFGAEQSLVMQEIMIGCTMGMLTCLNRSLRLAFILGDITEIDSDSGGYILNISSTAFRKRVSRARELLGNFMQKKCGLVNPDNSCRCSQFVDFAIKNQGRNPEKYLFADHACRMKTDVIPGKQLQEIDELQRMIVVFRSHPEYSAPGKFVEEIKAMIDLGKFSLFSC